MKGKNYHVKQFFYVVCYFCFLNKNRHLKKILFLGRAGNGRVALQIILNDLNDIEEAIQFCRETGDSTLWATLIEQSVNRPGKKKFLFKLNLLKKILGFCFS